MKKAGFIIGSLAVIVAISFYCYFYSFINKGNNYGDIASIVLIVFGLPMSIGCWFSGRYDEIKENKKEEKDNDTKNDENGND